MKPADALLKDDPSEYLFTQAHQGELSSMLLINPFIATMELKRGKRPLHLASKAKRTDLVRLLLQWGACPDAPDFDGRTAIDEAKLVGASEIVNLLQQALHRRQASKVSTHRFGRLESSSCM